MTLESELLPLPFQRHLLTLSHVDRLDYSIVVFAHRARPYLTEPTDLRTPASA